MPSLGERAPSFELPGVRGRMASTFDLDETLASGDAVILLFYPFDFSPVCTGQLCGLRDADFVQLIEGVRLWAISGDSIYAHWAFADEYGFQFPLLSDTDGAVASAYGVCYDEFEGHSSVPKRAVVLVDSEGTIQYEWHTEDAYETPDLDPLLAAIDRLPGVTPPSVEPNGDEAPVDGPLEPDGE